MTVLIKKLTQRQRVLEALRHAKNQNDGWVNGQYFLRTLMLSQYHARIWELERQGYTIDRGAKDEYGFCTYRLAAEPENPMAVKTREFCCLEDWKGNAHNPKCFKLKLTTNENFTR